mmetsp:Transcript_10913/g.27245  ORF Transcript_10913/g.27245 Transcript_10913/m.27245 type:complete len:370 (+) Transcript_10913:80-1189(+)
MPTETPYSEMEPPSQAKRYCKCCGKVTAGIFFVLLLIVILVQAVLYWWATLHCSASKLKDYSYPGGGSKNLVPADSLLVEQAPRWWGSSFINIPAEKSGQPDGASTGVWFRTWGPLWYTYTYQDILGQETFVVRDRPIAVGGSHKLMRCDGEGQAWVVSEGKHWIMNGIRSLFGMYTSRVYNIWQGNTLIAISEKLGGTGQSHKQIIFRDPNKAEPFASAFLKDRHFHGEFDEWFVQSNKNSSLPDYVPNAVAMLMAFTTAKQKAHAQPSQPSEFLEVTPIASAATIEGGAAVTPQAAATLADQSATAAATVGEAQVPEEPEDATTLTEEPPLAASAEVVAEQSAPALPTSSEESSEQKEESTPAEQRV